MKGDLTDVQAGDEVVLLLRGGSGVGYTEAHLIRVERTTATQVILADGRKFHRNGRMVGQRSGGVYPTTPENRAEAEALNADAAEYKARSRYRHMIMAAIEAHSAFDATPTDRLEAAYKALYPEAGS